MIAPDRNGSQPEIPDSPPIAATAARWVKVANVVVDQLPRIGLAAFAVFAVIAKHANGDGVAWPSIGRLTKATGLSQRTTRRALQTLKESGLLDWTPQVGHNGAAPATATNYAPTDHP